MRKNRQLRPTILRNFDAYINAVDPRHKRSRKQHPVCQESPFDDSIQEASASPASYQALQKLRISQNLVHKKPSASQAQMRPIKNPLRPASRSIVLRSDKQAQGLQDVPSSTRKAQKSMSAPQKPTRKLSVERLRNRYLMEDELDNSYSSFGKIIQKPIVMGKDNGIASRQTSDHRGLKTEAGAHLNAHMKQRFNGLESKVVTQGNDKKSRQSKNSLRIRREKTRSRNESKSKILDLSVESTDHNNTSKASISEAGQSSRNTSNWNCSSGTVSKVTSPKEQPDMEIQYFFIIEDILLNLYQSLKNNNNSINQLCMCYINLQKLSNQKAVYGLLQNPQQVSLLKNMFILERLSVFLTVYLQKWKNKKRKLLSQLTDVAKYAYRNFNVFLQLLLEILHEKGKLNQKAGTHIFQVKEFGKEKKYRQIQRICKTKLRPTLIQIFDTKELPLLELFKSLLESSTKIESLEFINVIDKTLKWEILSMPTEPFLPASLRPHTLVLDLDQTLIHFNDKTCTLYQRAYASEFLQKMSEVFEVVIFTAGTRAYAESIISHIDPKNLISYKLYRNHITLHEGAPIKDLSKLGRPMDKILIVDNLSSNFRLQPQNGILISSWYGQHSDEALHRLSHALKNIVTQYPHDLRQGVKQWSHYIKQQVSYNRLIYEMKQQL